MSTAKETFAAGNVFDAALEVATVRKGQPHVVILGAGASRVACPRGDANGKILPLMNDLGSVVGLDAILKENGIPNDGTDFERLYSGLAKAGGNDSLLAALEGRIRDYFSSLRLPLHPTIYDHLVLSLRPRDVIATFNWDPLLVQAVERNRSHVAMPTILFLHGNVAVGCCEQHGYGPLTEKCHRCGVGYEPSPLLFPVEGKDYGQSQFIRHQWQTLRDALANACVMTVFGYAAPRSDRKAVELLHGAWPARSKQRAEWIELINTSAKDDLKKTWDAFILSHHYDVTADFYDSRICRHPRRTGEAWAATHLFAMWEKGNPLPRSADFPELWAWYRLLSEVEDQYEL